MSCTPFPGTELCLVLWPSAKAAIVHPYSVQPLHNAAGAGLPTPTSAEARGAEGSSFQGKHQSPSTFIEDPLSFSGDIPDLPGQGPVQPAVGDPASAGGLD